MTNFKNNNYWAIILGGSSGMGLATAQKLASEGMNICILHRDRRSQMKGVEKVFAGIRAKGVKLQTFNVDAIRLDKMTEVIVNFKAQLQSNEKVRLLLHSIAKGNLKLLVPLQKTNLPPPNSSNPSETRTVSTEELLQKLQENIESSQQYHPDILSRQDFNNTLEAMALSLYDWVNEVWKQGLFAEDARIIGLTSEGNQKAWRAYAAVSAAKVALEAICRSIALEFAPYGIRCNVVQAGVTDTPSLRMIPGSETMKAQSKFRNPYGRLTTPEDVANVIYLLCREESAWINGAIIPVDGGERICT
ncbi:MAG: SDR family oxidoreductase [Chitinophagales bacterium]